MTPSAPTPPHLPGRDAIPAASCTKTSSQHLRRRFALPTHTKPRSQLIVPSDTRPFLASPAAAAAAARRCRRAAAPARRRSPLPPPADHANASAVHRHVQRCPCAVSPPTMPQAGLLAMPSRHRAVGSSNCCRRDRRSAEGASGGASPTSPPSPTIRCRRCRSLYLGPAPPVLLLLRLRQRRVAERPIRQARQRGVLVAPA